MHCEITSFALRQSRSIEGACLPAALTPLAAEVASAAAAAVLDGGLAAAAAALDAF